MKEREKKEKKGQEKEGKEEEEEEEEEEEKRKGRFSHLKFSVGCSEHSVVLASGDVLVFGGQSRLVYHGTRNLQPGSKPLGLRMAPGRLNFTFRQRDVGTVKSKDT